MLGLPWGQGFFPLKLNLVFKRHAGRQGSPASQREGEDPGPRATRTPFGLSSGDTGGPWGSSSCVSVATRSLTPTARPGTQSFCLLDGSTESLTRSLSKEHSEQLLRGRPRARTRNQGGDATALGELMQEAPAINKQDTGWANPERTFWPTHH